MACFRRLANPDILPLLCARVIAVLTLVLFWADGMLELALPVEADRVHDPYSLLAHVCML